MEDIRDDIFREISDRKVTAVILADDAGTISGTKAALEKALGLGLNVLHILQEGQSVDRGDEILRFSGNPKQLAIAEDLLMGCMAKPSGVATAAAKSISAAGDRIQIVCGSWKKMPVEIKDVLRNAVTVGGAVPRICPPPFIYLDKNYVRMLGGIRQSLETVSMLGGHKKVVQIKGTYNDVGFEAVEAAVFRADIVYIDSGDPEDVAAVSDALNKKGLRKKVEIAFGGNVKFEDIEDLKNMDLDILCIGKEIIDAPLLDLKMEVI